MTKPVRIGLFQLTSHPAVVIADKDYLEDPCDGIDLSALASSSVDIRAAQEEIRKRYVAWSHKRIVELFDWLSKRETLPDVVALPECGVPWECLESIQGFAKSFGITVIAAHTRHGAARTDVAFIVTSVLIRVSLSRSSIRRTKFRL